jgi:hypothetical protein
MLVEFSICSDRSALYYWGVMLLFSLWTTREYACGRLPGEGGELSLSPSLSADRAERERERAKKLPHTCFLTIHQRKQMHKSPIV